MGLWGEFEKAADTGTKVGSFNPVTAPTSLSYQAYSKGRKPLSQALGYDNSKQDDLNDQGYQMGQEEAGKTRERIGWMESNDRKYLDQVGGYGNEYLGDLKRNRDDAAAQATDARKTYSNDIQPRMKNMMEEAQREAGSAMTLSQSMDSNNQVHQNVEGKYNKLAQGANAQGRADYGVLAALGGQATANTMGASGPMTGGQMQLLNAGNQQQASAAFQKAQQRMHNLQQQGIDRGFEESDKAYDRGQMAKDRYAGSVGNYEGSMDRNLNRERSFRDEDMGYASDRYGIQRGMAGETRDTEQGIRNRDLAQLGMEYGNNQSYIANQMASANAENASKRGIFGGVVQGAATAAGGYMGGAEGAKAGAQGGAGINQGMQQGQNYGYQPYTNTNRRY